MKESNQIFCWACVQEFFVEDIAEVLLYVGRTAPAQLEGSTLQGIVMFLIVFVASPNHIRNPYLRSKLAEVRCPCTRVADLHKPQQG